MKKADYLIVGQGIAGTVLAHVLLRKGKQVLVMDEPSLSSCSRISAGMFNPVVIRRLTKSWMADELIPALRSFYSGIENTFQTKLLYEKEIVKLFAERAEREFWERKMNEDVGLYLSPVLDTPVPVPIAIGIGDTPFGHAFILDAGYVDVLKFLSLSRELFRSKGILLEEKYDPGQLKFPSHHVSYKDLEAGRIILCEGHLGGKELLFSFVPFNPAKGELLTVRIPDFPLKHTIHKGVSLSPIGNDLFRVGSTFAWDDINDEPTEAAKEYLLDGLKKITARPFEVVDHKAGVRPAVNDRRPVIGHHPTLHNVCIFNGMGSKGVMLTPYFAEMLMQHLEENKPLLREVDVHRFWRK